MDKKLKRLFDFQCFEKHSGLQALIEETESRNSPGLASFRLDDEDLDLLAAAGDYVPPKPDEGDEGDYAPPKPKPDEGDE